jgi:hypothetical protein
MKIHRPVFVFFFAVFAVQLAFAEPAVSSQKPFHAIHKTLIRFASGRKILADIADTPKEREEGLMFREKLPKNYGMLFVFSKEDFLEFWMKNTWVDLDMVFIGQDKKITVLYSKVKASTFKTTDADVARAGGTGQYVLELPSGTVRHDHLKIGQKLKFKARIPKI